MKVIISRMSGVFSLQSVEALAEDVRERFSRSEHWILNAARLESLDKGARQALTELFKEFQAAGGKSLVLHSNDRLLCLAVQIIANNANLPLKICHSEAELSEAMKHMSLFDGR